MSSTLPAAFRVVEPVHRLDVAGHAGSPTSGTAPGPAAPDPGARATCPRCCSTSRRRRRGSDSRSGTSLVDTRSRRAWSGWRRRNSPISCLHADVVVGAVEERDPRLDEAAHVLDRRLARVRRAVPLRELPVALGDSRDGEARRERHRSFGKPCQSPDVTLSRRHGRPTTSPAARRARRPASRCRGCSPACGRSPTWSATARRSIRTPRAARSASTPTRASTRSTWRTTTAAPSCSSVDISRETRAGARRPHSPSGARCPGR